MPKIPFHYEIHQDAGLAYDVKTGENARTYMEVAIGFDRELTPEEYKQVHEIEAVGLTSKSFKIYRSHIKPISETEFMENQDDADETE